MFPHGLLPYIWQLCVSSSAWTERKLLKCIDFMWIQVRKSADLINQKYIRFRPGIKHGIFNERPNMLQYHQQQKLIHRWTVNVTEKHTQTPWDFRGFRFPTSFCAGHCENGYSTSKQIQMPIHASGWKRWRKVFRMKFNGPQHSPPTVPTSIEPLTQQRFSN